MTDGGYSPDSSGDPTPGIDEAGRSVPTSASSVPTSASSPLTEPGRRRSRHAADQPDEADALAPDALIPGPDDDRPTMSMPAIPAHPDFDLNEVFGARSGSGRHAAAGAGGAAAFAELDSERAGADDRTDARRPAPSSAGRPPGDTARTVFRGVGQTLVTLGVVVLLFVAYELWITDIFSAHKQARATQALNSEWAQESAPDATTLVKPTTSAAVAVDADSDSGVITKTKVVQATGQNTVVADSNRSKNYSTTAGQGFAKIYIPALGPDYVYTVIEGTDASDLDVGPGHYADTQYPGQAGNFAMAGHRVSKGSPFNELGQLNSCDAIVIETNDSWYIYRILPMQNEAASWSATKRANCAGVKAQTGQYAKTFGREITEPSDYAQVMPVPHDDSATVPTKAEKLITLTTCHPQFSDAQRMIIHGVLVKSYAKTNGFHPTELDES